MAVIQFYLLILGQLLCVVESNYSVYYPGMHVYIKSIMRFLVTGASVDFVGKNIKIFKSQIHFSFVCKIRLTESRSNLVTLDIV